MSITPFVDAADTVRLSAALADSRIETLTLSDGGDWTPHADILLRGIARMRFLHNLTVPRHLLSVPEMRLVFQSCPRLAVVDVGLRHCPIPTLEEITPHLRWPLRQVNYVGPFIPGPIPCDAAMERIRQLHSREAEIMSTLCSALVVKRIGTRSTIAMLPEELLRTLKTHLFG
jgi:hypothetical protein